MDNNNIEDMIPNITSVKKQDNETIRDTFYGKIDVSVKTMDKVLIVLFSLLVLSIVLAVIL